MLICPYANMLIYSYVNMLICTYAHMKNGLPITGKPLENKQLQNQTISYKSSHKGTIILKNAQRKILKSYAAYPSQADRKTHKTLL